MEPSSRRGAFRFSLRTLLIGVTSAGLALFSLGWLVNHNYPYGRDHCCDKQLALALLNYADTHGGRFPTGGHTSEASLSLLYPNYLDANVLRGKTYPEEPARRLLASGRPLTPQTCGWHYVDGLSLQPGMNHRIALVWDKIGLGHNSEYLPEGGHSVVFMSAHTQVIREADWPRFIAEQKKAWAAIRRGQTPEEPWIPDDF
jgi:hypothetical protein